ncbi:hypothetical protein ACW5CM_08725 [Microbacterium sp. A588]
MSALVRKLGVSFAIAVLTVVVVAVVLVIILISSMRDRDGDELAAARVEDVARALAQDLDGISEPIDAETVAAERFHSRAATVEPLTWTGAIGLEQTGTIEARLSASVTENSIGGYYGPFNSAGSAVQCYRYTIALGEDVRFEMIPCDGLPEPRTPPASNRPVLPDDASEQIERILAAEAGSAVADRLRAEFPGEEFTIEVVKTEAGEVVVAVGVSPGTDCILRVRNLTGEVIAPSYDQIWLQPGEQGCSTQLYTSPPL